MASIFFDFSNSVQSNNAQVDGDIVEFTEQAYLQAMESDVSTGKSVTEQNELNIESAKATVKRKEADLAFAQLQLSYTKIVAPADGIVGERTIQKGELVNVNQVMAEIVLQ